MSKRHNILPTRVICRLASTVEKIGVLIDGRTGEFIGSVVDNKYCREKF